MQMIDLSCLGGGRVLTGPHGNIRLHPGLQFAQSAPGNPTRSQERFPLKLEAVRSLELMPSRSAQLASSPIIAKSACFSGAFLPLERNCVSSILVDIPPDGTFASCSTKTASSARQSHQLSPFAL